MHCFSLEMEELQCRMQIRFIVIRGPHKLDMTSDFRVVPMRVPVEDPTQQARVNGARQ